jgi:hypothetical protein
MATVGTFTSGQVLTAAELNSIGAKTAFTPTWGNLTVGNGTVVAHYFDLNDLILWNVELEFGSTTSISGSVTIDYPVAGAATYRAPVGGLVHLDDATGTDYIGALYRNSGTAATVTVLNTTGSYVRYSTLSSTVPFTWATGDRLVISDWYPI